MGRKLCGGNEFVLVASLLAVLHGTLARQESIELSLKISSTGPHVQGGNIALRVECHNKPNRSATAVALTLRVYLPYYFVYASTQALQASLQPDDVTSAVNHLTIKFSKREPAAVISLDVTYQVDPDKKSTPDQRHTESALAQLSYTHANDHACEGHVTTHTSVTFDFYSAGCSGFGPMGLSDGRIKESQLSFLSVKPDNFDFSGVGLHEQGSWSPAAGDPAMDTGQYVQVDFKGRADIRMVAIQARPNSNAVIDSMKLRHSYDALQWWDLRQPNLKVRKYKGKPESESLLIGYVQSSVITRYFRITPRDFRGDSSMRIEFYGCPVTDIEDESALGLESGAIPDNQLSASTSLSAEASAEKARLNSQLGAGAWCPSVNDNNQYLQVDLGTSHLIHSISTQGKFGISPNFDRVRSYIVEYSMDASAWTTYQENGQDKTFPANAAAHTVVTVSLLRPITARYLKLLPRSYTGRMCMRIELRGNSHGKEPDKPPVFMRSFLVVPGSKQMFVCQGDKPSSRSHCYSTVPNGVDWTAADFRLFSLLGFDKATGTLYGASSCTKAFVQCEADSPCVAVEPVVWRQARERSDVLLATEIPVVPVTGEGNADGPRIPLILEDAVGNKWAATSLGIHFKANGASDFTLVLAWHYYDVDRCVSGPCKNGGACIREQQSYSCACHQGWTGANCETDIDDCASAPCLNGAVCADAFANFVCACQAGYAGYRCEIDIDECASSPCQNGGVCTDAVNGYTCACAAGWAGVHCETDIDECASSPCQNGGVCTDAVNGYTCACAAGWAGVHCETDIDECASSPCQNGGTCTDAVNGYTCACAAGWAGVHCETDIDECASSPCQNGGVCTDAVNSYTCACTAGWAGVHCETDINECASSPCQNGGVCTDVVNGYTCACAAGWAGVHCETNIDECASSPCQNGGTCNDAVNSYTCTCPSGYSGAHCADNICSTAVQLTESNRHQSAQSGTFCDSSLSTKWYRLTGAAGTQMATSCPAQNYCSTHAPGWLNGGHPSVADGIVTRTVCYHWSSSCCHWSNNIRVLNCGAYYIYEFSPTPACSLRYCGA